MNKRRGQYASLDVGSMGVDVSMGPITNLDNKILDEVCLDDVADETVFKAENPENKIHSGLSTHTKNKPIDIMQESVESDKLVESMSEKEGKKDDDEKDVDTINCQKQQQQEKDTHSVVKRRPKKNNRSLKENSLPPGWEKHSDENGYYYWHVKSGTIQRDYPHSSTGSAEEEKRELVRDVRSSIIYDDEFDATHLENAFSPQPINKTSRSDSTPKEESSNGSSSSFAKDAQVHPQQQPPSSTSMQSSSSSSTNSGLSKSCTSSSIMDLGKEKESNAKRRSLPPCKEVEENGSNGGSGVRPMQVINIWSYFICSIQSFLCLSILLY